LRVRAGVGHGVVVGVRVGGHRAIGDGGLIRPAVGIGSGRSTLRRAKSSIKVGHT
jgi:hypothetical protein